MCSLKFVIPIFILVGLASAEGYGSGVGDIERGNSDSSDNVRYNTDSNYDNNSGAKGTEDVGGYNEGIGAGYRNGGGIFESGRVGDEGIQYNGEKNGGGGENNRNFRPNPFNMGYMAKDEEGNTNFRSEEGDENGNVRGSYGYMDRQGLYRSVEYVAGPEGFQAMIRTNEPGTAGKMEPADVTMDVQPTPRNIQDQYTRHSAALGGYGSGEDDYAPGSGRLGGRIGSSGSRGNGGGNGNGSIGKESGPTALDGQDAAGLGGYGTGRLSGSDATGLGRYGAGGLSGIEATGFGRNGAGGLSGIYATGLRGYDTAGLSENKYAGLSGYNAANSLGMDAMALGGKHNAGVGGNLAALSGNDVTNRDVKIFESLNGYGDASLDAKGNSAPGSQDSEDHRKYGATELDRIGTGLVDSPIVGGPNGRNSPRERYRAGSFQPLSGISGQKSSTKKYGVGRTNGRSGHVASLGAYDFASLNGYRDTSLERKRASSLGKQDSADRRKYGATGFDKMGTGLVDSPIAGGLNGRNSPHERYSAGSNQHLSGISEHKSSTEIYEAGKTNGRSGLPFNSGYLGQSLSNRRGFEAAPFPQREAGMRRRKSGY